MASENGCRSQVVSRRILKTGPSAAVWISALLGCAFISTPAQAELYQFIDANGVYHFSNAPNDPRYKLLRGGVPLLEPSRPDFKEIINASARQHRVDPNLVKAVIKVESDFDPQAVSVAGAMGLMQLMPETASTLGVENPFNPTENIKGGVKLLRQLLDRFKGNLELALAAYHAGAERVERYGEVPPIKQTQRYILKVMTAYRNLQGESPSAEPTRKVALPDGRVLITNIPK